MKNVIDSRESSSQGGDSLVRHHSSTPIVEPPLVSPRNELLATEPNTANLDAAGPSGDAPTVSYVSDPHSAMAPEAGEYGDASVNETDKTVISQRPVAPPQEFYRSTPLAELANSLEGKQLDHFSVETMIGGGGMGAVFRGIDTRLDRVVAVKVIPSSRRDAETLRRFRLEAQAAARLDHPNIARVYYVGEAGQWNYIVFEFIDGINIRDLVSLEGPLGIDDAVFYTRQVAEALQHAHERDVVHRDVKPSNVLVTASGVAKLVDMGLARDTSLDKSTADATASGVTLGTFDYISPEQARNPRDADARSDLYSLGCTLYYMLTGRPPFPDGTALQKLLNHGSLPPPDPRQWRADISEQLYEVLMKLMAKKPLDRYQKPVDLVNDLLLLAELENLPRSQGPSTLLIRPSIAQRSLLESHLPWIVGTVALLGSALWLQSIQSLPGDLTLPALKFSEPTAATASTKTNGSPTKDDVAPRPSELPNSNSSSRTTKETERKEKEPAQSNPAALQSPPPVSDGFPGNLLTPPKVDAVDVMTATVPAASRSTTEQPSLKNDPPARPAESSRGSALVVSETQPSGIAAEQWEPSLSRAIQRFADQSGTIEIRGIVKLDQPVALESRDLELVGSPGSNAVIQLAGELLTASSPAVFQINRSKLRMVGVQWQVAAPRNMPVDSALFRLSEGSSLDVERSKFYLQGNSGKTQLAVCEIAGATVASGSNAIAGTNPLSNAIANFPQTAPTTAMPSGTSIASPANSTSTGGPSTASESTSMAASSGTGNGAILVSFREAQVFGNGSLLRVAKTISVLRPRLEVSIEESLVAVTGNALQVNSSTGDPSSERILRVLCMRSTFVTSDSFALLNYSGEQQPLLGLSRTSQGCAYWSPARVGHIVIYGDTPGLLENPNLLALQGFDNAYDDNIGSLCQTYANGTNIFDLDFADGQLEGWFNERSVEREILWLQEPALAAPFFQADASDFLVEEAMFVPGYQPPLK